MRGQTVSDNLHLLLIAQNWAVFSRKIIFGGPLNWADFMSIIELRALLLGKVKWIRNR